MTFEGMSADLTPPSPEIAALLVELREALKDGDADRADAAKAELRSAGWSTRPPGPGWFAYARIGSRSADDLGFPGE